jgi:hypothetical protein
MQNAELPGFVCCSNMNIVPALKYVLHDSFPVKALKSGVILLHCYTVTLLLSVTKIGRLYL